MKEKRNGGGDGACSELGDGGRCRKREEERKKRELEEEEGEGGK